jgi:diaminopimelate decarboxylase
MLQLTPIVHQTVTEFLEKENNLRGYVEQYGSPLNILFPEHIKDSIKSFSDVFKKYAIHGRVYYAHKPNKSQALIKQAAFEKIFLDVASEAELKNALSNGFIGDRLEATGPKNEQFLLLALQHGVLISVDNSDELRDIARLHTALALSKPANILLRLCGFNMTSLAKDTRFGISLDQLPEALAFCKQQQEHCNVAGFSFHLGTSLIEEKVQALTVCIRLIQQAREQGFNMSILNIGGGFRVNYVEKESDWNAYMTALKESVISDSESLSWNNTGFGFRKEQGKLRGDFQSYDYYAPVAQGAYLDNLLSQKFAEDESLSLGATLSELMIELYIEPGRAMLNQAGITVAKVSFVKESARGELLVGLDMNKTNLNSHEQEMMVDPIIISKHKKPNNRGVYFVGNLCLESDFIYKHKTFPAFLPEKGDLVVFVNTAAYNMDFFESHTLQQRIARKIVARKTKSGFSIFLDDQYNPYITI